MGSGYGVRLWGRQQASALVPVDWLIKWNPRATDVAALAAQFDVDPATRWEQPRAGKRLTKWEQPVQVQGIERPLRRVLRLIERTIDKCGQALLLPDLTREGWTTSLSAMTSGSCTSARRTASPGRGSTKVPLMTTTSNSRPLGSRPML
jgi:hypothetical protein